jgi:hypothetical protein
MSDDTRRLPVASMGCMTPEEVEAICEHVKKTRMAEHLPGLPHAFPLVFRDGRILTSVGDLVGLERQAVAFLLDGIGHEGPPEDVFGEAAQDEGVWSPEVWEVYEPDGALAYRVWLFSDNGCVFRADTIDIIGGISQGGLGIRDPEVGEALIAARDRVPKKERPKDSVLDQFDLD